MHLCTSELERRGRGGARRASATPPGGMMPVLGRTQYFLGLVVFTCERVSEGAAQTAARACAAAARARLERHWLRPRVGQLEQAGDLLLELDWAERERSRTERTLGARGELLLPDGLRLRLVRTSKLERVGRRQDQRASLHHSWRSARAVLCSRGEGECAGKGPWPGEEGQRATLLIGNACVTNGTLYRTFGARCTYALQIGSTPVKRNRETRDEAFFFVTSFTILLIFANLGLAIRFCQMKGLRLWPSG